MCSYDGNVCQGGPRHYSNDAVDVTHTVWLFVRSRAISVQCPDTAVCAGLNRASTCRPSCSLEGGLCGECLTGFVGEIGEGLGLCTLPQYGDGSSAVQAAQDCGSLGCVWEQGDGIGEGEGVREELVGTADTPAACACESKHPQVTVRLSADLQLNAWISQLWSDRHSLMQLVQHTLIPGAAATT